MIGFVPSRTDELTQQRWWARLLYRGCMAVAGAIALAAILAPLFPRPQHEPGFVDLWLQLATNATLKKGLLLGAIGLWLTAVFFFRSPADFEDHPAAEAHSV